MYTIKTNPPIIQMDESVLIHMLLYFFVVSSSTVVSLSPPALLSSREEFCLVNHKSTHEVPEVRQDWPDQDCHERKQEKTLKNKSSRHHYLIHSNHLTTSYKLSYRILNYFSRNKMQRKWNNTTFFIIRGMDNAGLGMRNQPFPFRREQRVTKLAMDETAFKKA